MSYYDDDGNVVEDATDHESDATYTAQTANDTSSASAPSDDAAAAEIEEMKRRVKELEDDENEAIALAEAQALQQSSTHSQSSHQPTSTPYAPSQSSPDIDYRSAFIGNVDYSTTVDELQSLFSACGVVVRVTILVDKVSGHPKGFAYVEFASAESVQLAVKLNDTEFKGRVLSVKPKRTNVPAFQLQRGRGGRGGRGRARGFRGYAPPRGGGSRFTNRRGVYNPY